MDIKRLNDKSTPLSEKIIENGDNSFKLWLEFEETSPWDDLENDFANILVDTLDGRKYGINTWTIKFLATAHDEEIKEGNQNYIIPPDLFVKELTRDCIEEAIKKLLNEGNLEEVLNESVFSLNFIEPYCDVMDMDEAYIQSLMDKLKVELPQNHILNNESFDLIAKKENNDDIILELDNGEIAVVHLTWKGSKETKGFPLTRIYKNKLDFWNKEMRQDIIEFKEQ